jgi:hypothetical protein
VRHQLVGRGQLLGGVGRELDPEHHLAGPGEVQVDQRGRDHVRIDPDRVGDRVPVEVPGVGGDPVLQVDPHLGVRRQVPALVDQRQVQVGPMELRGAHDVEEFLISPIESR